MMRLPDYYHRWNVLIVAVLAGVAGTPVQAQVPEPPPAPPDVQVITAGEIAAAGAARLSDLFRLIDDWYATSAEGFAWDASAHGLGTLGASEWLVFVDGQPVDVSVFYGQNVNVLPVALAQIEYVEVYDAPVFLAGVLAQHGVLHLHTRTPEPGATVQGGVAAGNEIGDPGPYRYTSFRSANIDRIGPTLDAAASVAGAAWHVRAHVKADEHHATDERIDDRVRIRYLGEKSPRLLQTSAGFDAGVTSRYLGRHQLFAGFTRLQDLPFFQPLGYEAPTDHKLIHIGLAGDFFPGDPNGISYRVAYTVNDLDLRNNRGLLDFNVRQGVFRGHYEIRAAAGPVQGALGLSADFYQTITDEPLTDNTLAVPRAYARLGLREHSAWKASVTGYLSRVEDEAGYGALATVGVISHARHTLTLTGSAVRMPYGAQNTIWFWTTRDYTFFRRTEADVTLPPAFPARTTLTLDAAWRFRPAEQVSVTFTGGWRRFLSLTLPDYTYDFDPETTALVPTTVVRTYLAGQATTAGAEVRVRLVPSLEQRLHYTYVRYPTDSDAFFAAWRPQPWHRFSYTARYVPLARLSLYARLTYRSDTLWPSYFQAAEASNGLVRAELPGTWLLDLSVHKRFWKDHLSFSLALRNFLNEAYRSHPAGAITNMALHVRVRTYFNAGGGG